MTNLSVNLNKVALLRNQRDVGYPSLLESAQIILDAGAHGITIHPRPDERHIRKSDIPALADFIAGWANPAIELNIEGYPSDEFLELVTTHKCHQVTLVPDDPHQNTSDHGWNIVESETLLQKATDFLKNHGRRVSLFLDPVPDMACRAAEIGANRIELYTGPYAEQDIPLSQYVETAKAARDGGLDVNAGHDLSLDNLGLFIADIPWTTEVSIGHAITADALKLGWHGAVKAYLTAIEYGLKKAQRPSPEKDA